MGHADRRLAKADEQARLIVARWRERPRGQRSPEHLLRFYGWLSEHEPAAIPAGSGSFHKIEMILMPHVIDSV